MRYGPRRIFITDGHEAEALAAQSRKRPNRVGRFFLWLLGFRGEVVPPTAPRGHAGPSHERARFHERPTSGD